MTLCGAPHNVTIRTQIKDAGAVEAAYRWLQLAPPQFGSAQLYSGVAKGLLVQLPGWRYPLVLNLESAELRCDDFEGAWGDPARLDRFLQAYAVERARLEARKKGMTVTEQCLPCGSIRLQLEAPT